jgi:hypothetical protein
MMHASARRLLMSKVERLEKQIESLAPDDLSKLDGLLAEALADDRAGKARER